MNVKGIMSVTSATEEEPLSVMGFNDITVDANDMGLKGSPTRVKETRNKEFSANHDVRDNLDSREAAKLIVDKLVERHIL